MVACKILKFLQNFFYFRCNYGLTHRHTQSHRQLLSRYYTISSAPAELQNMANWIVLNCYKKINYTHVWQAVVMIQCKALNKGCSRTTPTRVQYEIVFSCWIWLHLQSCVSCGCSGCHSDDGSAKIQHRHHRRRRCRTSTTKLSRPRPLMLSGLGRSRAVKACISAHNDSLS